MADTKYYLDLAGLQNYDEKIKAYIKSKGSDVTDDLIALIGAAQLAEDEETIIARIEALEADSTDANAIKDLKEQLYGDPEDADDKGDIGAINDAIDVINGEVTVEGSMKKVAADAVAQVVAEAPEAFDTLKEIAEWIAASEDNEDGFDAAKRITALELEVGDPATEEAEATGLYALIESEIGAFEAITDTEIDKLFETEVEDAENGTF